MIDWIMRLGVDGPSGPDSGKFYFYQDLSAMRCTSQANPEFFPVVAAALAACRAAQAGENAEDGWWDFASKVRNTTDSGTLDCMDAMAFTVLKALVDAHRDYPELPFRLVSNGEGGRPTCLLIASRSPDEGSAGDVITVTGKNLDQATRVLLDASSGPNPAAEILAQSPARLTFRLPRELDVRGYNFMIFWEDRNGTWSVTAALIFRPGSTSNPSTEGAGDPTDRTSGTPPASGPPPTAGTEAPTSATSDGGG